MNSTSSLTALDVFKLTRELIEIPSITGAEAEVADFIAQLLQRLGYNVEMQEVTNGRANIIATTNIAPRVVLSTHMDTVPPYLPASEDEHFIHGRGTCDAKGIIAAQILAAERLRADGVNEIGLLFTVDEEASSSGARAANKHSLAQSCRYLINGEPTDNCLAAGSKGLLQVNVKCSGRAAHAAYPEQGESAIEKLLDVLAGIRAIQWPADALLGETTCNIGLISGGTRPNVIPPEAEAMLQIRLATTVRHAKDFLERTVAGRASLEYFSAHDPQRMLAINGFEQIVVRFTTDIPYLPAWGTPLLIGPGSILDAHTEHERVKRSELLRAIDVYRELVFLLLKREEVPCDLTKFEGAAD